MSDTDKPYTVSDRRHFAPDGRPREEAESEPPGEPAADPHPTGAEASGASSGDAPATPSGPMDFSQFLLSLGAQASVLLSGRGLPEGADPAEILEGARSVISILEMLRDKTAGRRTSDEDALLEGLLFELRMAYVEKTRARSK